MLRSSRCTFGDRLSVVCSRVSARAQHGGVDMSIGGSVQDSMFSDGDRYEGFMGRWSREIAPLLVRFAMVRDGDTVLDVGSGTGALSAAIATAAPSSHIVGI